MTELERHKKRSVAQLEGKQSLDASILKTNEFIFARCLQMGGPITFNTSKVNVIAFTPMVFKVSLRQLKVGRPRIYPSSETPLDADRMFKAAPGLQQGTASGQFRAMFAKTNNRPLLIIRPL